MELFTEDRHGVNSLDHLDSGVRERLLAVVDSHSFFPDRERKSREKRVDDNLRWFEEYGFVNRCYNEYGLDIENFRDQNDYIERYVVKRDRNKQHHGKVNPANHKAMVVDKINFYSYLEKMLPGSTPTVRVIFSRTQLYYPLMEHNSVDAALEALAPGKYVCKPSRGTMGADIFILEKDTQGFILDAARASTDQVRARLAPRNRYILQDFVHQHPSFAAVAPSSLNTVRVETVRWKQTTHVHYALARFSARPGVSIDNATQGGTFVGIDIDRGVLKKYGEYFLFENGAHQTRHPVSGVTYQDFPVPFWDEVLSLVTKLHPLFYGLVSVGWDIAITDHGPVVLEGNTSPCSKMAQMANGGLKTRWNQWKAL